jgi:hypothetical protein
VLSKEFWLDDEETIETNIKEMFKDAKIPIDE